MFKIIFELLKGLCVYGMHVYHIYIYIYKNSWKLNNTPRNETYSKLYRCNRWFLFIPSCLMMYITTKFLELIASIQIFNKTYNVGTRDERRVLFERQRFQICSDIIIVGFIHSQAEWNNLTKIFLKMNTAISRIITIFHVKSV